MLYESLMLELVKEGYRRKDLEKHMQQSNNLAAFNSNGDLINAAERRLYLNECLNCMLVRY